MNLIHAIYERGIFRPTEPVELSDGCSVEFEYRVSDAAIQPAAETLEGTSSNARRVQLIRKRFAEGLTESESRELQERQELAVQQLEEWDSRLLADVDLMQAAVEKVVLAGNSTT